jgi:tellurite resistance protein TerC
MNETFLLLIFSIVIIAMLLLDLGIFNKKQHVVSTKEATVWTLVWIGVSCIFGGFIFYEFGGELATQYFAAYLTEKSLSLDNIFVFVIIFSFFNIGDKSKHKVLFWGIIGAVILRAIFIFAGVGLIELTYLPDMSVLGFNVRLNILLMLFGIILIISGIKTLAKDEKDENKDYGDNFIVRLLKKRFPVSNDVEHGTFFIIKNGIRYITPLLLCMITIEISDVIFAVDSIPAIFGITQDPIILYTSNIFAILGLRSMYFMLSSMITYFKRLGIGISLILIFIGLKMLTSEFYHISSEISLCVILGIIVISILWSVIEKNNKK